MGQSPGAAVEVGAGGETTVVLGSGGASVVEGTGGGT